MLPQPVNIEPGSDRMSYRGMCYLENIRSSYSHAPLVLNKLSKSMIEVVQELKPI